MEEVVVGAEARLEQRHQVDLLDVEIAGDPRCAAVEQGHEPRRHLQGIKRRDLFAPGASDAAVPHVRGLVRGVPLLREPGLAHDDHAIGMGLGLPNDAPKMTVEMIDHRRRLRHRRADDPGARPHRARAADPPAGAMVHLQRPQPATAQPRDQLEERQRLRRPAEPPFGMTPEDVRNRHRRPGRPRRRAFLQPAQHVAGAHEDDDGIEPCIARQHPREQQIQRFGADTGTGNAADVYVRRAQRVEMSRLREQGLHGPGPAGVLIQKVPFGLAAAGDEHAIQALAPSDARHLGPPFAVGVDLEPSDWIELWKCFAVEVQA